MRTMNPCADGNSHDDTNDTSIITGIHCKGCSDAMIEKFTGKIISLIEFTGM